MFKRVIFGSFKGSRAGGVICISLLGQKARRVQGEPGPLAAGRGSSAGTTQILLVWASWRSGAAGGI